MTVYATARHTLTPQGTIRWRVFWDSNTDDEFEALQDALDAIEKRGVAVWYIERIETYRVQSL